MKNSITITLIFTLFFVCTPASSMSLKDKDNAYKQYIINENLSSKDKVNGFKFSGWKSLSNNYLIITAGHRKDYLVETRGECFNLKNAQNIKLNRSSSLTINKLGDSISPSGINTDKCYIKSIYSVTNIQADYLVNFGKDVENKS